MTSAARLPIRLECPAPDDQDVCLRCKTIGIEFSLEKLASIKRLIFGVGMLQVGLSTIATAGVLFAFGIDRKAGVPPAQNHSPETAEATASLRFLADVVTGSSSTFSTLPRTFFPNTAFHVGITKLTLPEALAWQARRMNGFS